VLADVQSIHQRGAELFVVKRDGSLARSNDWATFVPFDLGFDLALPTRVVPVTVAERDGRWLVLARLFEPGSDTPSPLAAFALLLGPKAP
jgi:hypothetical protein